MTLKEIRVRLLMTQEQLAAALGVSRNTIIAWERDSTPSSSMMRRIKYLCEKNKLKFVAKDLIHK